MDLIEFKEAFEQGLKANEVMTFYCQCSIFYSGRAEAELEIGDRAIIVKADNTLLVHQPEGSVPINYMKPKSKIILEKKEKHLLLKSQNLDYKDYLDIEIYRIHSFMSHRLEDGKKLELVGNEKDMSDMIYNQPTLISKDFKPLSREEHTKYGFIDVFGHNKNGELVIVECKRYSASPAAITQLRRYVEKMKDLKGTDKVHGIIAAPEITANAKKMAQDWGFKFVHVHPPKRLEKYKKDQKNLNEF